MILKADGNDLDPRKKLERIENDVVGFDLAVEADVSNDRKGSENPTLYVENKHAFWPFSLAGGKPCGEAAPPPALLASTFPI